MGSRKLYASMRVTTPRYVFVLGSVVVVVIHIAYTRPAHDYSIYVLHMYTATHTHTHSSCTLACRQHTQDVAHAFCSQHALPDAVLGALIDHLYDNLHHEGWMDEPSVVQQVMDDLSVYLHIF